MFSNQVHVLQYNNYRYFNAHSCGMLQNYFLSNQRFVQTPSTWAWYMFTRYLLHLEGKSQFIDEFQEYEH